MFLTSVAASRKAISVCNKFRRRFVNFATMSSAKDGTILQIEHDSGPINIHLFSTVQDNGEMSVNSRIKEVGLCENRITFYSTVFQSDLSFPQNVMRHSRFRSEIQSWVERKNIKNVHILPASCHQPSKPMQGYYLEKGFVFSINENEFDRGFQDKLMNFYEYEEIDSCVFKISNLCNMIGGRVSRISTKDWGILSDDKAFPVPHLSYSPFYLRQTTNSVYHNIEKVYEVLNDFSDFPEVIDLLEISTRYIDPCENLPLKANNSVIAVEGLDAAGKTTLTERMSKPMDATLVKSPPECICHLRSKFDSHPQILRRAFYAMGNYIFAEIIRRAAENGPVIADRFWHSTAAYGIATDVGVGGGDNIPPKGHSVYSWPSDLLKPQVTLLLTITEDERRKRMQDRRSIKTDEEVLLEKSKLFKIRVEESYYRMKGLIKVDANGTREEVLQSALELSKSIGF